MDESIVREIFMSKRACNVQKVAAETLRVQERTKGKNIIVYKVRGERPVLLLWRVPAARVVL